MDFTVKKIANYGTDHPIVARVSYQWTEILPWFDISEARLNATLQTLVGKVQPGLLRCEELAAEYRKLHASGFDAEKAEKLRDQFLQQAAGALEAFATIFFYLAGRNAPARNFAALGKWAQEWFGPNDPMTRVLREGNQAWIKPMADAALACLASPQERAGDWFSTDPLVVAAQMGGFNTRSLPFLEDAMMAALAHVAKIQDVFFEEIPEAERPAATGVRFRAMVQGLGGNCMLAGKVTRDGHVVPELQRMLLQGKGRPIIAMRFAGQWWVAAGRLLLHSPKWKNFHDFLLSYIKNPSVLGGDWANLELKKSREERHPLMNWYQDVTRYLNRHIEVGEPAPMTSLCYAYLGLAYNLYLISHNNGKVHEHLLRRLKDAKQFYGAFNETRINGMMIRCGFDIELEDESDSQTSHCEFTATHRASGQKLSVEAKFRESIRHPPAIGRQFLGALKKRALHQRLVVIEVNDPITPYDEQPAMLKTHLAAIRAREPELVFDGRPADPAYVLLSNDPPGTTDRARRAAYLFEGFKMDDFRMEAFYPSLRARLDARDQHIAAEALIEGIRKHDQIPASFEGEPSAYAASLPVGRLVIGDRYRMAGKDGEVEGELKFAFVLKDRREAIGILSGQDGTNSIITAPLTDQELRAYEESPDTFFGRYVEPTKVEDAVEFYDRMVAMYRNTSKERLLALLAPMNLGQLGDLDMLSQNKLVELYAEKFVEWTWTDAHRNSAKAPTFVLAAPPATGFVGPGDLGSSGSPAKTEKCVDSPPAGPKPDVDLK